jgi:type VI secretion system protein ImpA
MKSQADFELLELPISDAKPCGEDLEYSPLLASIDVYRLFGQAAALVPPPDWREIKSKSLDGLSKSKDIRLLAHLAAGVLRVDGLLPFCRLLQIAAHWIEVYWDEVYPLVDDDAILRKNALNSLGDHFAIVDALRRSALLENSQLGSISLRSIEIASGRLAPTDSDTSRPDEAQMAAVFAATSSEELDKLKAGADAAIGALKVIEDKMREAGGPDAAPDFEALLSPLSYIQRMVQEHMPVHDAFPVEVTPASGAGGIGTADVIGSIRSRQDAVRALDAVAGFFRQNEPSSPIPLFIERAKRLVAKDFLAVLADIAPDALAQAKAASGVKDE